MVDATMSEFIAALPMYDWPEVADAVDAEWSAIRDRLRAAGIDAPERLVRRNADMPPVPGGIRDASGAWIAADPATLPPDALDFPTLWRHPKLLFAQTCWGPMELGLSYHVRVIGQPDYSPFEGGEGPLYSSAIVIRRSDAGAPVDDRPPPSGGRADMPIDLLADRRLAFNSRDSMSGWLAPSRDLAALGAGPAIFSAQRETGGHRLSMIAVARGDADVAALDCRSWALARRFEPAAQELRVIGWTARRPGLPYITAPGSPVGRWPLD
jgi:ABC-type phosphate/phosphonate transport system substrate-binding protein